MVDINVPNFITVGLIAILAVALVRWAAARGWIPEVV